MRKYLLVLPAVALAAAQPAMALPQIAAGSAISTGGFVIASTTPPGGDISQATSLDFTTLIGVPSPGTPGVLTSYGTGLGSFTGVACANPLGCGTIQDLASLVTGPLAISNFVVLTGGTNVSPISFDLASISNINRGTNGFLTFTANGTINWAGFDPTPGTFLFSAQGLTITSFSATALSAVPEPATWAMMLLGFAGMGMVIRRRRPAGLAQLA